MGAGLAQKIKAPGLPEPHPPSARPWALRRPHALLAGPLVKPGRTCQWTCSAKLKEHH